MSEDKFEVTDGTKAEWPTYIDGVCNMAFIQADEFMALGQSPSEASSIVAQAMIIAAWQVAASGKVADGGTPDPDKFRAAVNEILDVVKFKEPTND